MTRITSVIAKGAGNVAIGSIHVDGRLVERSSAPCIHGSGVAKTEQRALEGLPTRVATDIGHVSIAVGQTATLEVTADDNLLAMLRTEIDEDTLRITFDGSAELVTPVAVRLTLPSCQRITLKGIGTAEIIGLNQEAVQLKISGSGSIPATGRVDRLKAKVSGAGSVDAAELVSCSAKLDISGTGEIQANVTDTVEIKVSGIGEVKVSRNPRHRTVSTGGIGSVQWL
jgi:hypothetical protein